MLFLIILIICIIIFLILINTTSFTDYYNIFAKSYSLENTDPKSNRTLSIIISVSVIFGIIVTILNMSLLVYYIRFSKNNNKNPIFDDF